MSVKGNKLEFMKIKRLHFITPPFFLVLFLFFGCTWDATLEPEPVVVWPALPGYELMGVPSSNPMTVAKVELGKQLYYDPRLSGDGKRSCYGCHLKEHGLTDGKPVAIGAFEKLLTRSAPTMWNVGYYNELYWDGRSKALEKQVKGAWSGGNMGASGKEGAPSMEDISSKLNQIKGYQQQFSLVFGSVANPDNVAYAIAAFMRTLVADQSRWARFQNGEEDAFSEQERRGWQVFNKKAHCTNCHDSILLTDMQYHNIGIGMDTANPDIGRKKVSGQDKDMGAFKTPTLLDVSKSAPYFHNGSIATLEEAVDLMLSGGIANQWLDEENLAETRKASLTDQDKQDLLAFLNALDVDYNIQKPTLP